MCHTHCYHVSARETPCVVSPSEGHPFTAHQHQSISISPHYKSHVSGSERSNKESDLNSWRCHNLIHLSTISTRYGQTESPRVSSPELQQPLQLLPVLVHKSLHCLIRDTTKVNNSATFYQPTMIVWSPLVSPCTPPLSVMAAHCPNTCHRNTCA